VNALRRIRFAAELALRVSSVDRRAAAKASRRNANQFTISLSAPSLLAIGISLRREAVACLAL